MPIWNVLSYSITINTIAAAGIIARTCMNKKMTMVAVAVPLAPLVTTCVPSAGIVLSIAPRAKIKKE